MTSPSGYSACFSFFPLLIFGNTKHSASLPNKALGCFQSMLSASKASLPICSVKRCPMSFESIGWIWADDIAVHCPDFTQLFLSAVEPSVNTKETVLMAELKYFADHELFLYFFLLCSLHHLSTNSSLFHGILDQNSTDCDE